MGAMYACLGACLGTRQSLSGVGTGRWWGQKLCLSCSLLSTVHSKYTVKNRTKCRVRARNRVLALPGGSVDLCQTGPLLSEVTCLCPKFHKKNPTLDCTPRAKEPMALWGPIP